MLEKGNVHKFSNRLPLCEAFASLDYQLYTLQYDLELFFLKNEQLVISSILAQMLFFFCNIFYSRKTIPSTAPFFFSPEMHNNKTFPVSCLSHKIWCLIT